MVASSPAAVSCPACQSTDLWDNRSDKRSNRSPDFRCKACDTPVWLNRRGNENGARRASGAAPATNGRARDSEAQPAQSEPENDPDAAFLAAWRVYRQCLASAIAHVGPKLADGGFKPTAADVLSATATLFIAATRGR